MLGIKNRCSLFQLSMSVLKQQEYRVAPPARKTVNRVDLSNSDVLVGHFHALAICMVIVDVAIKAFNMRLSVPLLDY